MGGRFGLADFGFCFFLRGFGEMDCGDEGFVWFYGDGSLVV